MRIDDDNLYYGAALIQVAEDPRCKSIRRYRHPESARLTSFVVNREVGLHIRYCSSPLTQYHEYHFQFNRANRVAIQGLAKQTHKKLFLALVCIEDREICCVPYSLFRQLVQARREEAGVEDLVTINVSLHTGHRFEVYVNAKNDFGRCRGKKKIARTDFPSRLLEVATSRA